MLDEAVAFHYDELLKFGVVPVLTFGDARFGDVDAYLTGIEGVNQFGKAATVIHIHLQGEGGFLVRQVAEVGAIKLLGKAASGYLRYHQGLGLLGETLEEFYNLAQGDVMGNGTIAILAVCLRQYIKAIELAMVFFALQAREHGIPAHWPYICFFAGLFAWIDFLIARYYKSNIIFLVTFEVYLGMAVCLAADHFAGSYHGWAVSWSIPAGFLALEIATVLLGWSEGLHMVDYAVYLFVDTLLSLLQLVPILQRTNPFPLPATLCMVLLLAYLAFIVIFRGRDLRNAITKFLNF